MRRTSTLVVAGVLGAVAAFGLSTVHAQDFGRGGRGSRDGRVSIAIGFGGSSYYGGYNHFGGFAPYGYGYGGVVSYGPPVWGGTTIYGFAPGPRPPIRPTCCRLVRVYVPGYVDDCGVYRPGDVQLVEECRTHGRRVIRRY